VYPCGRIEVSAKSHRILTCSAEAYLEIINPDNLNTVGKTAYRDDQYINDFAVDDLRSRVLVLSSRRDGSIRLTAYSMPDGRQLQEASLPTLNATKMSLVFASKTGQIGVAVDGGGHSGGKSDIYICGSETTFSCTNVAQISTVLQMSFLGRQILVATNSFADNKKDCILAVDPTTRSVSHEYCSPATGVHYAVGVVDKKYIVAFTGISKRKVFREENKSVASSFSVRRAEIPQVAVPQIRYQNAGSPVYFPDRFPISVRQESGQPKPVARLVFIDDGLRSISAFVRWLDQHAQLLRALHHAEVVYASDNSRNFAEAERQFLRRFPPSSATKELPRGLDHFLDYLRLRTESDRPRCFCQRNLAPLCR
jgi:hypothetical protein